jgi:membrane protein implicated in regulation of membrane protease activity
MLWESILAAIGSAIFSYAALSDPATLAAVAIRRKMPDAWFSGLIVWYANFAVIAISIVIAGVAYRMVQKRGTRPTPRG